MPSAIMDIVREAPLGQLIRFLTNNRVLLYPEERPGFALPPAYRDALYNKAKSIDSSRSTTAPASPTIPARNLVLAQFRFDLEFAIDGKEKPAAAIAPRRTAGGTIIVDWYSTDDPANPQNWSRAKRALVSLVVCVYTFAVYCGSSIWLSSEIGVMEEWGISMQEASLPLSLYVLAYGLGPLLFAPLSEIPSIGRNPVYAVTFAIFVIISVPAVLVKSFGGLLALRFLQGFFGSPCLANGGASMQDMYSELNQPYAMVFWVSAAYGGPALGPLLSGYAVSAMNWRWSLRILLWLAAPILILMLLCLAETSTPTILLRRAQRLRKLTSSPLFQSSGEIADAHLSAGAIVADALVKPLEISLKDPSVGFTNAYVSLTYSIYYMFFEIFGLVYPPLYHFTLPQLSTLFVCIIVACFLGASVYSSYLYFYVNPSLGNKRTPPPQEHRLLAAIPASVLPPIGLFLFGWAARADIHWIVSVSGIVIYSAGVFVILQCVSIYIPCSYPKYAASLFAANDFCRSALAAGAIHFARPLYLNLGIARGVSVLAGVSTLGVVGILLIWRFGAVLRAKSKFAVS